VYYLLQVPKLQSEKFRLNSGASGTTVPSPDQLKWRGTITKKGGTKIDQNFAD